MARDMSGKVGRMASGVGRFGFAAVVVGGLAAMAGLVGVRVLGSAEGSGPPATAEAASPQGGGQRPAGGQELTRVVAGQVQTARFSDAIQVTGTAQAKESIEISPKVTDVIAAIRFDSGQRVARGAVLVEISAVEQRAALAEAEAQEAVARRELERFQELFDRGFAPRSRLDLAQAGFDRAVAQVDANTARLADRTIRAPFAGVVGLRNASPGQLARPGDVLGTLDDVSTIKLDFDVPETQLQRLQTGVDLIARSAAYPDRQFPGRIEFIDSRVSEATRTVRVRALLPNREGLLRPGMLLSVQVDANPREALAVPETATVLTDEGTTVFKLTEREGQMVVSPVRVRVGQRLGGMVEVLDGLSAGDRFVAEGIQRVRPGQPVRVEQTPTAGPSAPTPTPTPERR